MRARDRTPSAAQNPVAADGPLRSLVQEGDRLDFPRDIEFSSPSAAAAVVQGVRMERDKSHRGNESQFFVAGELCCRGYAALVPIGNTPNTDILCSNRAGTRFVHIQAKTFVPGTKTCSVGAKAQRDFGAKFYRVIAGPRTNV